LSSEEIKNQIKEKIKDKEVNGAIKCPVALKIANELKISPKEVGEVLNGLNIKLKDCQLGCF
jgi:DNA-binding transcriptional regulator YhcF (GntR family)